MHHHQAAKHKRTKSAKPPPLGRKSPNDWLYHKLYANEPNTHHPMVPASRMPPPMHTLSYEAAHQGPTVVPDAGEFPLLQSVVGQGRPGSQMGFFDTELSSLQRLKYGGL